MLLFGTYQKGMIIKMKLATILTDYLSQKGFIEPEDYEIYQYGFEIFLELFINIICSILIAVFLDMKLECVFFFLFFIPLRSFGGGLHMERYFTCLLLSCGTLAMVLLIVKYYVLAPILSFLLILLCIIALRALGPVNHPNRSVDASENICFQKKMDITLILGFIFALLFWFFHFEKYLFLEALVYLLVALTSFIGKQKNSRKRNF